MILAQHQRLLRRTYFALSWTLCYKLVLLTFLGEPKIFAYLQQNSWLFGASLFSMLFISTVFRFAINKNLSAGHWLLYILLVFASALFWGWVSARFNTFFIYYANVILIHLLFFVGFVLSFLSENSNRSPLWLGLVGVSSLLSACIIYWQLSPNFTFLEGILLVLYVVRILLILYLSTLKITNLEENLGTSLGKAFEECFEESDGYLIYSFRIASQIFSLWPLQFVSKPNKMSPEVFYS